MTVRADDGSQDGFTLVEMLIALVLLAMLTVVLLRSLEGVRQWQATLQQAGTGQTLEPTLAYVRRSLSELRPLRISPADTQLIEAAPQRLSFVTSHAPFGDYRGPTRVTWEIVPAAGQAGIFELNEVRQRHRPGSQPAMQGAVRTRLLGGLGASSFAFADAKGAWATTWNVPLRVPALVRLELGLGSGGAPVTIVIAIPTAF
jgi:prepilin-type N-terminal cleavage/methylation domain-containing protein